MKDSPGGVWATDNAALGSWVELTLNGTWLITKFEYM
jgi:hypothetical protein